MLRFRKIFSLAVSLSHVVRHEARRAGRCVSRLDQKRSGGGALSGQFPVEEGEVEIGSYRKREAHAFEQREGHGAPPIGLRRPHSGMSVRQSVGSTHGSRESTGALIPRPLCRPSARTIRSAPDQATAPPHTKAHGVNIEPMNSDPVATAARNGQIEGSGDVSRSPRASETVETICSRFSTLSPVTTGSVIAMGPERLAVGHDGNAVEILRHRRRCWWPIQAYRHSTDWGRPRARTCARDDILEKQHEASEEDSRADVEIRLDCPSPSPADRYRRGAACP